MAEAKAKKEKKNEQSASGPEVGKLSAADELSAEERAQLKDYVPSLKRKYREEIIPAMVKRFAYKNVMQVPRIEKVVVNMGVGEASRDPKLLEAAMRDLALITGQKPKLARAKKSISAFKIRTGMPVGCFVTLRGNRMYEFLERLIRISIPRIRDFRGLPTRSFDGRGNHSMGVREHTIFMELDINKVTTVLGMNITTVTTAKNDEEALELLRLFGFPFRSK
ncbi:MAG: 50S ribosomal protein L5 [Candidatus Sumerlaeaceae bacterium]|jgi:large subunit ribosomal protein L5